MPQHKMPQHKKRQGATPRKSGGKALSWKVINCAGRKSPRKSDYRQGAYHKQTPAKGLLNTANGYEGSYSLMGCLGRAGKGRFLGCWWSVCTLQKLAFRHAIHKDEWTPEPSPPIPVNQCCSHLSSVTPWLAQATCQGVKPMFQALSKGAFSLCFYKKTYCFWQGSIHALGLPEWMPTHSIYWGNHMKRLGRFIEIWAARQGVMWVVFKCRIVIERAYCSCLSLACFYFVQCRATVLAPCD